MLKKLFSALLSSVMILSIMSTTVFASDLDPVSNEETAQEWGISIEEVEQFEENFSVAIEKYQEIVDTNDKSRNLNENSTITVPISENLVLEVKTISTSEIASDVMTRATTYRRIVSSTWSVKNIFGGKVLNLKGTGIFLTNGSTSKPENAYGSYTGIIWTGSTTGTSLGSSSFNSYVTVSFSGELKFGIDPISATIQSFGATTTINCNANGATSSSWR